MFSALWLTVYASLGAINMVLSLIKVLMICWIVCRDSENGFKEVKKPLTRIVVSLELVSGMSRGSVIGSLALTYGWYPYPIGLLLTLLPVLVDYITTAAVAFTVDRRTMAGGLGRGRRCRSG